MRAIKISTDVFAAIWAARQPEENNEDSILRRLLGVETAGAARNHQRKSEGIRASQNPSVRVRWVDDIVSALNKIGGEAPLAKIYKTVRAIREANGRSIPKEFEATIREAIEIHSSDSQICKYPERDYFCAPYGKGAGIWALRAHFKKN